jgi:hypothetical protein
MKTYAQYYRDRAKRLREDYPDSTPQERAQVLRQVEREWMTELSTLPRDTVVPFVVGRSLVKRIGHAEATRILRHVANYPACLPIAKAQS